MRSLTYILSFILFLSCASCGVLNLHKTTEYKKCGCDYDGDHDLIPLDAIPGKCYGQSYKSASKLDEKIINIYEYIGDDFPQEGVFLDTINIQPGGEFWIEDHNQKCKHTDCIVRCLEELTQIYKTYYVVNDTNLNRQFALTHIPIKTIVPHSYNPILVEVICEKDLNVRIIKEINNKLMDLGYLDKNNQRISINSITPRTNSAISEYQKEYGLPVGNLNIKTLEHLGISIN